MNLFKRKVKPSKPPEILEPHTIDFVGEQKGPVENDIKSRFHSIFASTPTVQSAYLAQLSYGDQSKYSVGLCIRSSIGVDQALQKRLASIFAEIFRADEHLDILFLREDQEIELRKVCKPFYEIG